MKFEYIKYENFPLILFFRLLQIGERGAKLFCRMKGIPLREWEKTKERFEIATRDPKGDPEFEDRKLLVLAWVRMSKTAILLRWIINSERDRKLKEVCEIAGIKWIEDPQARFEYLTTEIRKAEKRAERLARKLDMDKEVEEVEAAEDPEERDTIYDAIASLELMGYSIPSYEELTVPKYIAMTRVAQKRLEKQQENG